MCRAQTDVLCNLWYERSEDGTNRLAIDLTQKFAGWKTTCLPTAPHTRKSVSIHWQLKILAEELAANLFGRNPALALSIPSLLRTSSVLGTLEQTQYFKDTVLMDFPHELVREDNTRGSRNSHDSRTSGVCLILQHKAGISEGLWVIMFYRLIRAHSIHRTSKLDSFDPILIMDVINTAL